MSEQDRAQSDATGVEDAVAVVVRGAGGEVKHASGVKGPDPAEWGDDAERPSPFAGTEEIGTAGVPQGEVAYEDLTGRGKDELMELAREHDLPGRSSMSVEELAADLGRLGVGVVKGPGRQWETDDQGRYVNR